MEKKLNFKKLAQKELSLAKIMEGRDKIDTEDIIEQFPDGFTIDEIELVNMTKNGKTEAFWAFHIKGTEYFAFAGMLLSKIFESYLKEFEGVYDDLYEAFAADEDGLSVKLSESSTKDGKNLIKVEVL